MCAPPSNFKVPWSVKDKRGPNDKKQQKVPYLAYQIRVSKNLK
jgi:hypothetical protein